MRYMYNVTLLIFSWCLYELLWSTEELSFTAASLCIPRPLPCPADAVARIDTDFYGRSFRGAYGFPHGLHQVLGIAYQHLCGFLVLLRAWWWNQVILVWDHISISLYTGVIHFYQFYLLMQDCTMTANSSSQSVQKHHKNMNKRQLKSFVSEKVLSLKQ